MPSTSLVIQSPVEDVWAFLVENANWRSWHGTAIRSVTPGWETGAKITWENGQSSQLEECTPHKSIRFGGAFMSTGYDLVPSGESTEVRYYFEARHGASFSDGGAAHLATYAENLRRLKQLLENSAGRRGEY